MSAWRHKTIGVYNDITTVHHAMLFCKTINVFSPFSNSMSQINTESTTRVIKSQPHWLVGVNVLLKGQAENTQTAASGEILNLLTQVSILQMSGVFFTSCENRVGLWSYAAISIQEAASYSWGVISLQWLHSDSLPLWTSALVASTHWNVQ